MVQVIAALLLSLNSYWVSIQDGAHIHKAYVVNGRIVGEYTQLSSLSPFSAECESGIPKEEFTEKAARAFVLRCHR